MVAHSFNLGRGGRDRTTYRDRVSKDKTKTLQDSYLWSSVDGVLSFLLSLARSALPFVCAVTGEQTQDLAHSKRMLPLNVLLLMFPPLSLPSSQPSLPPFFLVFSLSSSSAPYLLSSLCSRPLLSLPVAHIHLELTILALNLEASLPPDSLSGAEIIAMHH